MTEIEKEVMVMNTADLLVKCLEQEGVEYIFGIPGEETLDMINAIENSTIKFIVTRHEQGAAFMADVYGRLTGKAGVCLATLGPGATNLVTGVADANLDGAPLLAITGQVGTDKMHITSHQYLDLVHMFEPITKRSKQIVRPDTVTEIVRLAFKYAEMEKPGAVHIDLPNNIASMPVEGNPLKKRAQKIGYTSFKNIERAARMISIAKYPVILVGSEAVRNDCSYELTKFAEEVKIPVVNTMMAKGIISYDSKYSLWTTGIPQIDYVDRVLAKADLVIAVGYDIVEYNPRKWNGDNHAKIIHISTQPADVNKNYEPSLELIGSIADSLEEINKRADRAEDADFALTIKEKIVAEHEAYAKDNSFPIKPQRLLNDVRKVMGKDDIVISDVGAHKMWIARHYNCYKPNTCIISNGFASMGIAVPGAVAAKLINPDKKVLAITGDGGFMMNSQELETALRIGTPIVVLILNDESYGLIKWKQQEKFNKTACVDFTNPNFKMYAESMNCKGYTIEKTEDLIPTLIDAFKQKIPSVIDCRVDYNENIKLTQHLKQMEMELGKKEELE
ncbi:MAG TPA: acetolactate synthase large subunit [Lachnospiraceae bacterium]|nr:acetolactate synthase large subunit [Lachnospiraceae bacterium]